MTRSNSSARRTTSMPTPQRPSLKRKADDDDTVGASPTKKTVGFEDDTTPAFELSLRGRLRDCLDIDTSLRSGEIVQLASKLAPPHPHSHDQALTIRRHTRLRSSQGPWRREEQHRSERRQRHRRSSRSGTLVLDLERLLAACRDFTLRCVERRSGGREEGGAIRIA